jgi:hypothetical protein
LSLPSEKISTSLTDSTRPSLSNRHSAIRSVAAAGLRMKSIEQLVVTASACGPIRLSVAR